MVKYMSKTVQQKKGVRLTVVLLALIALAFYIGLFFVIKASN